MHAVFIHMVCLTQLLIATGNNISYINVEIQSILPPQVNIIALTATASKSLQESVTKLIGLINPNFFASLWVFQIYSFLYRDVMMECLGRGQQSLLAVPTFCCY